MRSLLTVFAVVGLLLAVAATAGANIITLEFDPNDIFDYATSDNTRLNQQGTARAIWGRQGDTARTVLDFVEDPGETGRYYQTYNDGSAPYGRMTDTTNPPEIAATAAKDLKSVENVLEFTAGAGYQGVCWFQLYLGGDPPGPGGIGGGVNWGQQVYYKGLVDAPTSMSVNGEYDWRTSIVGPCPVYDTELLGEGHQNAFSPDFNPAEELFSVTADLFVDLDGDKAYDGAGEDLVLDQDYTLWFYARLTNWGYTDDYGHDSGWNPGYIEGTLIGTAVPEPATLALMGLGGVFALLRRRRRS